MGLVAILREHKNDNDKNDNDAISVISLICLYYIMEHKEFMWLTLGVEFCYLTKIWIF